MNRTHITIVNQAVDFIVDHLFDPLSVDMIADHCCFSRHYFNRVLNPSPMKAFTDLSGGCAGWTGRSGSKDCPVSA